MPPTAAILNDPIGRHARPADAALRPDWTITESLAHMRAHPPGGRVVYFYVTNADGKLVGVVPTRRLLLSAADARIADVMIRGVVAVPQDATVLEACEFFSMHRLLALPVVDADKRLVGIVDVELYTDELSGLAADDEGTTAARADVFQLIGVHLTAGKRGPWQAFRGRFPWLLCNVGGGLLAAFLSGLYDDVLNWQKAVLALFVPVVLALAESVAIQSVTLALQNLHGRPPTWVQFVRLLAAESVTGVMLGAGTAAIVAVVASVWLGSPLVGAVVFGGIACGVTAAAVAGLAVPTLLRLVRRDPQLAAGPIALVAADVATLLIYFNLARLVI